MNETAIGGAAREFPPTRWSVVRRSVASEGERRQALGELCEIYWKPLYCFARRSGLANEQAKDMVQGLLVSLLEGEFPSQLDPEKGRLRAYLKTALKHAMINEHQRQTTVKRGGGARRLELDCALAERELASAPADPGAAFEREWALGVMERSLDRLIAEISSGRRGGSVELARRFLRPGDPPGLAAAAEEAGMTVIAFKAWLHRLRRRYRELVQLEVADTVDDGADAAAELDELLAALRPGPTT